ncbi:hypothetical protein GGS24DRAFT_476230 [Hypoxylon argillaceum]|nr:hypothetical protein GGS24DRAFT_476230 [Hypoxylon argillaceum]
MQGKVTFFKRQDKTGSDTSTDGNRMVMNLIVISFAIEILIIIFALSLGLYTCIEKQYQRRRLRLNPERQRAQQVLNSHPQPMDIELDVLNPHPDPRRPWASSIELPTITPNSLGFYDPDSDHTQTNTPVHHNSRTEINSSAVNNPNVGTGGQRASEAATSEGNVTVTETMHPSAPHANNLDPELDGSHPQNDGISMDYGANRRTSYPIPRIPRTGAPGDNANETHNLEGPFLTSAVYQPEINGARSESSSLESYHGESPVQENSMFEAPAYDPDAMQIYDQNGIIVRDWAYHSS